MADDVPAWIEREREGCRFADERLGRRLRTLLGRLAGALGESIPFACQDWANTQAAYRFFANDRVSEEEILGGHFQSTRDRVVAAGGPVMILHGTSEFSYPRRRAAWERRSQGSARPAGSTAARTRPAATACTPSAGS